MKDCYFTRLGVLAISCSSSYYHYMADNLMEGQKEAIGCNPKVMIIRNIWSKRTDFVCCLRIHTASWLKAHFEEMLLNR